jgi:putative ABC transport system permease protein
VVLDANTLGVRGDFQSVVNYHVSRGRFIGAADEDEARRVCVLGPDIAGGLGIGDDPIGKVVLIGDQPFAVVGLMERKGFTESEIADIHVPNRNRDVYIPYQVQRLYFPKEGKGSELDVISFRMAGEENLVAQSALIRHIVADLHQGAEDFGVFVPLEKLKQAQETKRVFNIIIVVIAGIALLVGGIGIMNIMLVSVTERTREIGIRMAVGSRPAYIRLQFLAESIIMSVTGGLIGILIGGALSTVLGWAIGLTTTVSVESVAISFGFAMAVGMFFGYYPAHQAASLDPIDALRYE